MKVAMIEGTKSKEFKLSGGFVLFVLIAFFVVVMGVNGIMAYLAVDTFSGVQSEKPYENGLAFNRDIAKARAQDAQGWVVDETVTRAATGDVSLNVRFKDSSNQALTGLTVTTTLKAPVDSRHDCKVMLTEESSGVYMGVTPCAAGQWDIETLAQRGNDIVYRSISRIILH